MIGQLITIVFPVFATAAVGYGWVRLNQPFDHDLVGRLIFTIATPCLVFASLTQRDLALGDFAAVAGAAALFLALMIAVAVGGQWLLGRSIPARAGVLSFPNAGNMGLPIALFAFGEAGLSLAVSFFAVMTILHFTVGIAITAGHSNLMAVLRQPIIYAVAAAIGVMATDLAIPTALANTLELLGQLAIPLMLLSLGAALPGLKTRRLGEAAALAVTRPVAGLAIAGGLVAVLPLSPLAGKVVILLALMPPAVVNYLLAQRFGRDPELAASTILLGTLMSVGYIPLALAFLL